ncbi:MAG: hypothetical protein HY983_03575 [Candidatus Magasanikbacteria bacterium]|nr:hypothetical protein [Candidatus Magasanikbacteria bacterium]
MDQILRLNEFFVEGGRQELSHVLLHITEPSTPDEMDKGYFFAVCEINNADAAYISRLQTIIDQAENDYYEISDQPEKNSLELLLEKINQETPALIKTGVGLHCVVGAIRRPEIFFAYHGDPHLVLFYKDRQGNYQKIDLTASSPGDGSPAAPPGQLFSQIIQGKISPHDYLFVGTPHIVDYFNYDRLEKIVTTRPALESARHLERVLGELKDGYSFGGLLLHLSESTDQRGGIRKIPASPERATSTASLRGLFRTEQQTSHTLSASILPHLKATAGALFRRNTANRMMAQPETPKPRRAAVPTEIHASHAAAHRPKKISKTPDYFATFKETTPKILMAIGRGIWSLLLIIFALVNASLRTIGLLAIAATNYQNRRRTILEDWRRNWHSHRENFKQLPFLTKVLIISALGAGLIFAGSLVVIRYRQNKQALEQQFQTSVQLIKTKTDAVESALIYKDNTGAIENYSTAENIFNNLTCRSKEQQATCANIKKQLQNLAGRVRKITVMAPNLLADWKSELSGQTLSGVSKISTKLVAYSDTTATLYVYDLLTKKIAALPAYGGATGFTEGTVPKENDYALLATQGRSWLKFAPSDNTLAPVEITYPAEKVTIAGGGIYNRRLYTLDTLNHQIYRHDSIKTGFGLGKEWLKAAAPNLALGDDLTIDGDVYVLETNGQIEKFTAGLKAPFQIQGLYPALTHGGKIWTYTDLNTLYILDSAEKRLILIDKDGRLKAQLTAAEFNRPSGFAIDAANATAYISDGTRLFSLPLPQ